MRIHRMTALATLVLAALLMITGLASAQPGYGEGGPTAGLSASASGDILTVVGNGFVPGEPVTGTVFSDPMDLGTKNADPAGSVSFTFSVRGLAPGEHRVVLSAPSGSVTVHFTVTAAQSADAIATVADASSFSGSAASGNGAGELAFTGSNVIIPAAVVGLLLLLGGGAAVAGSRRRRSRTTNRT